MLQCRGLLCLAPPACLPPHRLCPLSLPQLCLSVPGPGLPSPSLLWLGVGLMAHPWGALLSLRLQVPCSGGGGARLSGSPPSLPLHPCLSLILPLAGPPHPSLFCPRLRAPSPSLSPSPLRPPPFLQNPLPQPQTGPPAPGEQGCPLFQRRGEWERVPCPPGPGQAAPSPQARLYKANRPLYSAAWRAGLPEAALYGAAAPHCSGPALGGGGGRAGIGLGRAPAPHLPPPPAPGSPDPGSDPSSRFLAVRPWEKPP